MNYMRSGGVTLAADPHAASACAPASMRTTRSIPKGGLVPALIHDRQGRHRAYTAAALAATAMGALAIGAMAVGAMAIGKSGALAIFPSKRRARIKRLVIDELVVKRLQLPPENQRFSVRAPPAPRSGAKDAPSILLQRLEHLVAAFTRSTAGYWRQAAHQQREFHGHCDHPDHTGSGIDQPHKPNLTSRIIEKITQSDRGRTQEPERKGRRQGAPHRAGTHRLRPRTDKPTERDAQIDGSGARFETSMGDPMLQQEPVSISSGYRSASRIRRGRKETPRRVSRPAEKEFDPPQHVTAASGKRTQQE